MNKLSMTICSCLMSFHLAVVAGEGPYNAGVTAWKGKDYTEAMKRWSESVLEGNVDAMNNLGYLYFNGLGTKPRVSDAIMLWRAAAYSGQSESQTHLAFAYERGRGVEKDPLKAVAWYRCSIESAKRQRQIKESSTEQQIQADAAKSLAELVSSLAPDDLVRANAIADNYIARYGLAAP